MMRERYQPGRALLVRTGGREVVEKSKDVRGGKGKGLLEAQGQWIMERQ
jgi:hypothetical protein